MKKKSIKDRIFIKMPTKLLVGAGNPGEKFYSHRHNIGFRIVDQVAKELKISFKYDKKKSVFGKKKIGSQEIIMLKPQTFINLSGESVLYIASFLKVDIHNILVVFDDINLDFGSVLIGREELGMRHSGINHIEVSLNNTEFHRLAFGIGPKPDGTTLENFYLNPFSANEEKKVPGIIKEAKRICVDFLQSPLSPST